MQVAFGEFSLCFFKSWHGNGFVARFSGDPGFISTVVVFSVVACRLRLPGRKISGNFAD